MKIKTKFILIISALTSFVFLIYTSYKGIILYFVNEALEDTFIGGNTSDISIFLWFIISGILTLLTLMFLFFLRIRDLKSQRTIVIGLTFFWLITSFFMLFINLWITIFILSISIICFLVTRNLKEEILKNLNEKRLTNTEIHLLQKLAGIDKK